MAQVTQSKIAKLERAGRLVVKIGSSLITDSKTGGLNSAWLSGLASDLSRFASEGREVVVVTSGAVALGRASIGLSGKKKLSLEEKQAASACGQIELVKGYQKAFARHGRPIAQVLLTLDDTENRKRYLNARSAMETMLKAGVIPVINENDTVATAELRFGDNDRLSARVAQMLSADMLILFSDIDGLYTANPRTDKNAAHIPEVAEITREIEKMAGAAGSEVGTGGMVTKIAAARIAVLAGCCCVIARGNVRNPLSRLISGKSRATWFLPAVSIPTARKQWIMGGVNPCGYITIDEGAENALKKGKSLLPAGAVEVNGSFERGDLVIIKTASGREMARGISSYSAEDARRIMGKKSGQIEGILGFSGDDELVHRNNLVMT